MKISQLIKKLETIKAKEGDLEVHIVCREATAPGEDHPGVSPLKFEVAQIYNEDTSRLSRKNHLVIDSKVQWS